MKTYFYIIQRDGQIFEIENIGERYTSSMQQWQKGGLIVFPTLGIGINAVDISKIVSEEQYQNYIDSAQPKQFIKNGTWYDIKERSKPIRYEKWREIEIEEKRKMSLNPPAEKEYTSEEYKALFEKYRPEFMRKSKEMIPPHDPELTANAKTYQDE